MHDPLPQLHFEFPFEHELLQGRAHVALARVRGGIAAVQLAPLLVDSEEAASLARRVSHPRRLHEALLARLARDELKRRMARADVLSHSSLSHTSTASGVVGAAALSEHEVGVDIEPIESLEGRRGLVERILSAEERRIIDDLPEQQRDAAILRRWCAKEALAKALGTGLTAPLEQYATFPLASGSREEVLGFGRFPEWMAICRVTSELVISVCLRRESSS